MRYALVQEFPSQQARDVRLFNDPAEALASPITGVRPFICPILDSTPNNSDSILAAIERARQEGRAVPI